MEILEMETQKDTEAVEGGFVESRESQSLNLCGQMPGEVYKVPCFGEDSKASVLVGGEDGGGINVNRRNVEVSDEELNKSYDSGDNGCTFDGLVNKGEALASELVAEENQTTRGSSGMDVQQPNIVKPQNNGMNDASGQALILEGNKEIGAEKVVPEEGVEKGDDAIQQSEVLDSPRKIEVSGDGFSLFVEVFGSMDGNNQGEGNCSDRHALREGGSDLEDSFERNGALSSGEERIAKVSEAGDSLLDVMKSSSISEEVYVKNETAGEDSCNRNKSFNVGDVVWAKTKTQIWWPGMITDPSNSSKGAADSHKKEAFLVKYYGNANFIWCFSSQLKHFLECFDEMSRQNNSRNFRGAVERAVNEIGRRVKVEMTCSCSLKENQKISAQSAVQTVERYLSKEGMGEVSAFSESQLQPVSFLQLIKYLAQGAPLPGKIKLTVTQNCLSAFYHSLGHCQLPMRQLRTADAKDSGCNGLNFGENDKDLNNDGKENDSGEAEVFAQQLSPFISIKGNEKDLLDGENDWTMDRRSGKGYESRERRKSKYLSYPYIDPKKGNADAPTSGENVEDPEKVPHLGAEMKSNSGQSNGGKKSQKAGSQKSSNCSDMLGKAMDIKLSSAEILSELLLTALDCSCPKGQLSGSVNRFLCNFRRFSFLDIEMANKHIGDEVVVKVDGMTKSSNYDSEGTNGKDPSEHNSSSGKPKKRRTKKEDGTSVGTFWSGSVRNALSGPGVIKCQGTNQLKEAGTVPGLPDIKEATGLPDLNGNIPVSSAEDCPGPGTAAFHCGLEPNIRQPEDFARENAYTRTVVFDPSRNNIKFVQLLKDVQAMGPNFLNTIPQQNNMQGEPPFTSEVIARQSEANGNSIQFGSLLNSFHPTPLLSSAAKSEQRRRKRKDKASNLPDLNGNVADSVSATDTNSASAQAKPLRKRRRNKFTAAVPDISANHNKLQNSLGVSGPSLTPLVPPLLPVDGLKSPAKPSGSNPQNGDPPDLLFIKKNLEKMKSTLEKAGNNLSPEMRAKLESEIKAFMQKISSMVGSPSS